MFWVFCQALVNILRPERNFKKLEIVMSSIFCQTENILDLLEDKSSYFSLYQILSCFPKFSEDVKKECVINLISFMVDKPHSVLEFFKHFLGYENISNSFKPGFFEGKKITQTLSNAYKELSVLIENMSPEESIEDNNEKVELFENLETLLNPIIADDEKAFFSSFVSGISNETPMLQKIKFV